MKKVPALFLTLSLCCLVGTQGYCASAASKVTMRGIIDPEDNEPKDKMSLPKNYDGNLYISGQGINSLATKHVYVRFNFGIHMASVTLPATIGRKSGINQDMVIVPLEQSPFGNVRLLYDLFDYNTYGSSDTPVTDPADKKLYCRGLKLDHDPTFRSSATNTECDATEEVCYYAYAKIRDSGMYTTDASEAAFIPNAPQLDEVGTGYAPAATTSAVYKCLPDNNNSANFYTVLGLADAGGLSFGSTITLGGTDYVYNGPFRPVNESNWQIKADSNALFSDTTAGKEPTGLFEKTWGGVTATQGYRSFLFPRAGKMALRSGIQYFGSSEVFGTRELKTNVSNGETSYYMDGCNLRVTNYDKTTGENISSCNVTATIDLLTIDNNTGAETILSTTSEVKLQLIRPSLEDSDENEVFIGSFKSCNTTKSCASDECCFNNRCWSNRHVPYCAGDLDSEGNAGLGTSCTTDFDCSSLCCKRGVCGVHLEGGTSPILCSKSLGDRCIAKEWCVKVNVRKCYIVKTPNAPQECSRRCYNYPTFADCVNGHCTEQEEEELPPFDEENPNCKGALDPAAVPDPEDS